MSATSASPPTEPPAGIDPRALERLIGVRTSKPSFYAAWRDKSDRLDHTIETLERISSALCAAPAGPVAVCDAVVEAASHHFGARWAAMVFSGEHAGVGLARVFVHASHGVIQRWSVPPKMLEALADRTLAAQRPLLADHDEGLEFGGEPCVIVTAPMPVQGEPGGILAVGLPDGVDVAPSDVSILVTLANHAGVALHNASLFQENQRRSAELERRGTELEGTLRRLEQAGRRQLLSEERNRIARELHDSVSQHLLTIGMNLEWCRRQESISPAVLERVLAAQSLARSSMDEIREVIFELSRDGQTELPRALREVIEDAEAGTRLEVTLRVYGQTQPVPAGTQHALVQIAREALFNVARHAGAKHAWVTLRWRPQVVSLAIADDGSGNHRKLQHQLFIPSPGGDHLGLIGIADRVRSLGGAAWFERRRGGGVKLRVEVPVSGTVADA
jgi:signal transduction histidine kinase